MNMYILEGLIGISPDMDRVMERDHPNLNLDWFHAWNESQQNKQAFNFPAPVSRTKSQREGWIIQI
jgi:hypothetical protein